MPNSRVSAHIKNGKVIVKYKGDKIRELAREEAIKCGGQIAEVGKQIDGETSISRSEQDEEDDIDESEIPTDRSEPPEDSVRPVDRLSDTQQQAFFAELQDFVNSEREAERENNWERYTDLGIDEAILRSQISGPFVHLSKTKTEDGPSVYRYQMAVEEDEEEEISLRDDESLFEGNICILDVENGGKHFPIEVELFSVGDAILEFQPNWGRIDKQTPIETVLSRDSTEVWLDVLLNPVPFERRLSAIRQVKANHEKKKLLTAQRPVEFTVNTDALSDREMQLNDYQQMALIRADSADDAVCIHGPPGTGKTRTLTAYVLEAVSQGQSVLVTAHSNQAVDNLLVGDSTPDEPEEDTLHAIAEDPDENLSIARVGGNS